MNLDYTFWWAKIMINAKGGNASSVMQDSLDILRIYSHKIFINGS